MANLTYRKINTSSSPNAVDHSDVHTSTTVKGSGLTWAELNGDFYNLNADIQTRAPIVSPAFTGNATLSSDDIRVTSFSYPDVSPTLDLDFQNSARLDPRIQFTRTSTATRVNEKGNIESVSSGIPRLNFNPVTRVCRGVLVEPPRTNFSNATNNFVAVNTDVVEVADLSPFGSWDALSVTENTSNTNHDVYWSSVTVTANRIHSFSIFVKARERTSIEVWLIDNSLTNGTSADFNLTTQAITNITNQGAASLGAAGIEDYGNGWYRVRVTSKVDTSSTLLRGYVRLQNAVDANSYTGDGSSGLLVWGPQIEEGPFITSYIPKTAASVTRASVAAFTGSNGKIQSAANNVLRTEYHPTDLSIVTPIVETLGSTNLVWDSQFTSQNAALANNQWDENNVNLTLTANSVTSPNNSVNAALLSCSATSSFEFIKQPTTLTATGIYTYSLFAKPHNSIDSNVSLIVSKENTPVNYSRAVFSLLGNGVVVSTNTIGTGISIVRTQTRLLDNGWYRITITVNNSTAATNLTIGIYPGNYSSQTANSKVYIWGAQLETKQYATSYIPTTTSGTATRSAETVTWNTSVRTEEYFKIQDLHFHNFYNPDEGTFAIEFDTNHTGITSQNTDEFPFVFDVYGSLYSLVEGFALLGSAGYGPGFTFAINNANVNVHTSGFASSMGDNTVKRFAIGYKSTSTYASINGVAGVEDTDTGIPQGMTKINFGRQADFNSSYFSGHYRSFVYYPVKLTNAQVITLSQV